MRSQKLTFQITDRKYARLRNWQRAIEEKIRNREIETGQTWDGQPIPEDQIEMLKDGTASVHWGYCTQPYSYEFSPRHPNASNLSEQLQYVYGPLILVRVKNNVTRDSIDLNEAFSEWDMPEKDLRGPVTMIRMIFWGMIKTFKHLRFRIFGPPKSKDSRELGGIPYYSDVP